MKTSRRASAFVLTLGLVAIPGCATSDYGRITHKISSYEAQALETRRELAAATDPAARLSCLNTLIRNTENQLKIARRINPQTNPQYRDKTISLGEARADTDGRVKALEQRLAGYLRERDAIVKESHEAGSAVR